MDAELRKEINEAVEKSLPKQVGTALQERLRELEMKERQLETTTASLETSQKALGEEKANVADLTKLVATDIALQKREREVAARETAAQVFELEVKLKASEASNEKVMGFVAALMRNTEFKTSSFFTNDHHFNSNMVRSSAPMSADTTKTAE